MAVIGLSPGGATTHPFALNAQGHLQDEILDEILSMCVLILRVA